MKRLSGPKLTILALVVLMLTVLSAETAPAKHIFDALPQSTDYDFPFYMEYTASSTLPDGKSANYHPSNVDDEDPTTAWVEGASGHGLGEWIQVEFSGEATEMPISKIGLISGYAKGDRFKQNNRVKKALLVFSNGKRITLDLKDTPQMQYFTFEPVLTEKVRLIIESVYPGTKWDDTCISEIEFHVPEDYFFKPSE